MQILGLILILINIGAVAAPVTAVAVIYQNNLVELIVPSEAQKIVSNVIASRSNLELPQYESYTYDPVSRTVTVKFRFTNPLNMDLSVNSVEADVKCSTHYFDLGHAALSNPVEIDAKATVSMAVVFVWTQDAEAHFLSGHVGETNVEIKLVHLVLDVSGIAVETPESITLAIPTTL